MPQVLAFVQLPTIIKRTPLHNMRPRPSCWIQCIAKGAAAALRAHQAAGGLCSEARTSGNVSDTWLSTLAMTSSSFMASRACASGA